MEHAADNTTISLPYGEGTRRLVLTPDQVAVARCARFTLLAGLLGFRDADEYATYACLGCRLRCEWRDRDGNRCWRWTLGGKRLEPAEWRRERDRLAISDEH